MSLIQDSGNLRAEQVTAATPSTSSWQHWGVSMAGQRSMGARFSMAAAEARAAKAVMAKVVNCILDVLVGCLVDWFGVRLRVGLWSWLEGSVLMS